MLADAQDRKIDTKYEVTLSAYLIGEAKPAPLSSTVFDSHRKVNALAVLERRSTAIIATDRLLAWTFRQGEPR